MLVLLGGEAHVVSPQEVVADGICVEILPFPVALDTGELRVGSVLILKKEVVDLPGCQIAMGEVRRELRAELAAHELVARLLIVLHPVPDEHELLETVLSGGLSSEERVGVLRSDRYLPSMGYAVLDREYQGIPELFQAVGDGKGEPGEENGAAWERRQSRLGGVGIGALGLSCEEVALACPLFCDTR